ncbi:MAG: hypothetical protein HYT87_18760 [Nitrospirae bacterium]|nr:hypothetical protein [Nitrospirota bacterium]
MVEPRTPRKEELSEVDFKFFDYLMILWRAKWIFVLVMAGATAVTVVRTKRIPRYYEATCSLVIMESESMSGGESASGKGSGGGMSRGGPGGLSLSADLYRELATSNRVMMEIVKGLQLDQPPYNYSADSLKSMIRFSKGGGDRLFYVTASSPDPVLAQKMANFMGQALVNTSREIKASRYATMQESLEAALATVTAKMDETAGRLDAIEKKFSVATRKSDFEETKIILEGTARELSKLGHDIAETSGRLESIRGNLSAFPTQVGGQGPAVRPSGSSGGGSGDREINETYLGALGSKIKLEETLSGLSAKRKELIENRVQTAAKMRQLESEITRVERQLGMIKLQYEVLSDSYQAIGRKLEETRVLAAADIVPGVIVIDPAPLPGAQVGPDLRKNITRANLFAFGLSAFGILAFQILRKKTTASA